MRAVVCAFSLMVGASSSTSPLKMHFNQRPQDSSKTPLKLALIAFPLTPSHHYHH